MSTKKLLSCIIVALFINVFSSFSIQQSLKSAVESSFNTIYLKQTVSVSGINYNVYLVYDTVQEAVINAVVYTDECGTCPVSEVTSFAIMVDNGGGNWYASSQIYVTTSCRTFMLTGDFIEEDPTC